jgi:hypothetical protein
MKEWFFTGRVLKVINGRTIQVEVDLGFEVWKRVNIQFDRIWVDSPPPDSGIEDRSETVKFLETHLKNKDVSIVTLRKKNRFKSIYYLAEVYIAPRDLEIQALDINLALNSPFKREGLLNVSDVLVRRGLADYSAREIPRIVVKRRC